MISAFTIVLIPLEFKSPVTLPVISPVMLPVILPVIFPVTGPIKLEDVTLPDNSNPLEVTVTPVPSVGVPVKLPANVVAVITPLELILPVSNCPDIVVPPPSVVRLPTIKSLATFKLVPNVPTPIKVETPVT